MKQKSKAAQMIEDLATAFAMEADLTNDGVKKEFEKRLKLFDFEGIQVDSVDIDHEGDVVVTFSDDDGSELEVIFLVDEGGEVLAIVTDTDDEDDESEVIIIELTSLNPSIIDVPGQASYVNLIDLSWMNRSTLRAILSAGDVDFAITGKSVEAGELPADSQFKWSPVPSAFGEDFHYLDNDQEGVVSEGAFARVVRGGKVVRLPLVRRKRRRVITGAVRAGIRRATLKRKAKVVQSNRKRKKALRIRKRSSIQRRSGNTHSLKVAGGADRKK